MPDIGAIPGYTDIGFFRYPVRYATQRRLLPQRRLRQSGWASSALAVRLGVQPEIYHDASCMYDLAMVYMISVEYALSLLFVVC